MMIDLPSRQYYFLLFGPRSDDDDAFDSEEQVASTWSEHREELLAGCAPGRRPWGWRVFDSPRTRWRDYAHERAINWRAGILHDAERAELEAEWYADFTRGRSSDAPPELLKRWTAERRKESPPAA